MEAQYDDPMTEMERVRMLVRLNLQDLQENKAKAAKALRAFAAKKPKYFSVFGDGMLREDGQRVRFYGPTVLAVLEEVERYLDQNEIRSTEVFVYPIGLEALVTPGVQLNIEQMLYANGGYFTKRSAEKESRENPHMIGFESTLEVFKRSRCHRSGKRKKEVVYQNGKLHYLPLARKQAGLPV